MSSIKIRATLNSIKKLEPVMTLLDNHKFYILLDPYIKKNRYKFEKCIRDDLYIIVTILDHIVNGDRFYSIDVSIDQANSDPLLFNLSVYGLNTTEFVTKYELIESKLISAWGVINK